MALGRHVKQGPHAIVTLVRLSSHIRQANLFRRSSKLHHLFFDLGIKGFDGWMGFLRVAAAAATTFHPYRKFQPAQPGGNSAKKFEHFNVRHDKGKFQRIECKDDQRKRSTIITHALLKKSPNGQPRGCDRTALRSNQDDAEDPFPPLSRRKKNEQLHHYINTVLTC